MAEGHYPEDLKYHREHDWVRVEGDEAVFGITWYAQDALGEVVYFDAPDIDAAVEGDAPYAELESVKAVSDVYAPLTGTVVALNDAVKESPGLVNSDPYGDGWLLRVRMSDQSQLDGLMDAAAYTAYLDGLS
ncbi:MAG: glycine cleavage system protein GcvH [Thermoleophilia bacterium]|nr:glycine cleavage system protein GcvH [Thermoleophilia bacterium]